MEYFIFDTTNMIPILEVQGIIALLLTLLIVLVRVYYCNKVYNSDFIVEVLVMAALTSLMWYVYCVCKNRKALGNQFLLSIVLYIMFIAYFKRSKKMNT